MNEGTRNQLEVKLKSMLIHLAQAKAKQKQQIPQPGTGNIIRRREGEKDKRFSQCIQSPEAILFHQETFYEKFDRLFLIRYGEN